MVEHMIHDHSDRLNVSPLTRYQDFLREGKLAYQYDAEAQRAVFHPRVVSPYGGTLEWRISSGRGLVYATTWISPRNGEPYNVALVQMDEGFRLMSRVAGVDPREVRIGDRVRVKAVQEEDDVLIPVFEREQTGETQP